MNPHQDRPQRFEAKRLSSPRLDGLRVLRSVVLIWVACLLLPACAKTPYVWARDIPAERAAPAKTAQTINPGDSLSVVVIAQAKLSGEHVVGADGTIVLPNVGAIPIAGKTAAQAEKELKLRLSNILGEPRVSIVVVARRIEVGVLGEVQRPGKYMVRAGDGVASALAMAGGLNDFADSGSIYLVRESEPLRIRFRMRDLVQGGDSARAFALRDGDLLVIE